MWVMTRALSLRAARLKSLVITHIFLWLHESSFYVPQNAQKHEKFALPPTGTQNARTLGPNPKYTSQLRSHFSEPPTCSCAVAYIISLTQPPLPEMWVMTRLKSRGYSQCETAPSPSAVFISPKFSKTVGPGAANVLPGAGCNRNCCTPTVRSRFRAGNACGCARL